MEVELANTSYEIAMMNRLFNEMNEDVDESEYTGDDDYICCADVMNHIPDEGRILCATCGRDTGPYLICNTSAKICDKAQSSTEVNGSPINPHLPDSSMGTTIGWTRNPAMMRNSSLSKLECYAPKGTQSVSSLSHNYK